MGRFNLSNSESIEQSSTAISPVTESLQRLCLIILCGFLALASVIGNSLVILAICCTPVLRRAISNWLLISLAVADVLTGLITVPGFIYNLVYHRLYFHKTGDHLANAQDATAMVIFTASAYSISEMSLDRFIAVKFALRYNSIMTPGKCLCAITTALILSLMHAAQYLLTAYGIMPFGKVSIMLNMVVFVVPYLVTIACHVYILKEAWRQSRSIAALSVQEHAQQSQKRRMNLTVALVVGLNLACMMPLTTYMTTVDRPGINVPWQNWSLLMVLVSSAFNPWIYVLRIGEFRQAFKKLLRDLRPRFCVTQE